MAMATDSSIQALVLYILGVHSPGEILMGFLAIGISGSVVCMSASVFTAVECICYGIFIPSKREGERGNRCWRDPYLTRNCAEDLLMLNSVLNKALKV